MKRRAIISILITIVAVICANKFWLTFKPIPVSMDISGNCTIEVQLNKKDNDKFDKIKTDTKTVNSDTAKTVHFSVSKSRFPKRLRFVVSNLQGEKPLVLCNIAMRGGGRYLAISDFAVSGAATEYKDDKLILTNISQLITLTYTKPLKTRASIVFDFKLFTIVLVLTFLLTYKITDYIADFKTVKNKSRIKIIFLTIFFIFLLVPMSNISQEEISVQENRTLTKWKPLIAENGEINYNFGKDFNAWFNDRFFLRYPIVKGYNSLKYCLAYNYAEVQKGFVNKRTKWMSSKISYPSQTKLKEEDKKSIINSLTKFKEFCDKNNIKFYIIIAPLKKEICIQELKPFIGNMNGYKSTMDMIEDISKQLDIQIIYPYDEIVAYQQKTKQAFFKTDHHWTDEASYLAYKKLMPLVKKDFPDIKISNDNDFNYIYSKKVKTLSTLGFYDGQTANMLQIHDPSLFDVDYKYYEYKYRDGTGPFQSEFIKLNDIIRYHKIKYNTLDNKYKLVMFGDSFTLNLVNSLSSSFSDTQLIYTYSEGNDNVFNINNDTYKKELLEIKPDIIVICFCDIIRLRKLFL